METHDLRMSFHRLFFEVFKETRLWILETLHNEMGDQTSNARRTYLKLNNDQQNVVSQMADHAAKKA